MRELCDMLAASILAYIAGYSKSAAQGGAFEVYWQMENPTMSIRFRIPKPQEELQGCISNSCSGEPTPEVWLTGYIGPE